MILMYESSNAQNEIHATIQFSLYHLIQNTNINLLLPFKETIDGESESYGTSNYDLWAKCRVYEPQT
jgi:hypothetical protein